MKAGIRRRNEQKRAQTLLSSGMTKQKSPIVMFSRQLPTLPGTVNSQTLIPFTNEVFPAFSQSSTPNLMLFPRHTFLSRTLTLRNRPSQLSATFCTVKSFTSSQGLNTISWLLSQQQLHPGAPLQAISISSGTAVNSLTPFCSTPDLSLRTLVFCTECSGGGQGVTAKVPGNKLKGAWHFLTYLKAIMVAVWLMCP